MEEWQSADVERTQRQLKDREHAEHANNMWKGLQVQDKIKSPQASTLLAGGQDVNDGENESDGIFAEERGVEMA
jgi:hypothetical protein